MPVLGSGPTESWNWPNWVPLIEVPGCAVQVTDSGAAVAGFLAIVAVQPGSGAVRTEDSDLSPAACVGKVTFRPVVVAVADSVGTWKVMTVYPPCTASGLCAVTCADAVPAASRPTVVMMPAVTQAR